MLERFTIIDEQQTHELDADLDGTQVRIPPAALAGALGWKVEERGLCRGAACVAIPAGTRLADERGVDLTALANLLDRPLALDVEERVAALAAPAADRAQALSRREAPDFALPDLQGRLHRLSEHRGKKVLLIAHASW
jgi:hypothetical protein